jgi:hypothetical protein
MQTVTSQDGTTIAFDKVGPSRHPGQRCDGVSCL